MGQDERSSAPTGATGYIRAIHRSGDAETGLVKLFFEELHEFAESQIGEHLQQRIGPSDIANAALRSALSEVRKKGAEEWSTDRFRRLAKTIAAHKVLDAADAHGAQKRDEKREVGGDGARIEGLTTEGDDPAERAAAKELAVLWASEAMRRVATEAMSAEKRLVAALTVGGYQPKQIHDILQKCLPASGDAVVPSLRLVQLVAKKTQDVFDAIVEQQTRDLAGS